MLPAVLAATPVIWKLGAAVAKGFQAIVITPVGPEVVPAMNAAADKGLKVILVDNNLDAFTKKMPEPTACPPESRPSHSNEWLPAP